MSYHSVWLNQFHLDTAHHPNSNQTLYRTVSPKLQARSRSTSEIFKNQYLQILIIFHQRRARDAIIGNSIFKEYVRESPLGSGNSCHLAFSVESKRSHFDIMRSFAIQRFQIHVHREPGGMRNTLWPHFDILRVFVQWKVTFRSQGNKCSICELKLSWKPINCNEKLQWKVAMKK